MQNSGLTIVLAKQAFPLLPLAPVGADCGRSFSGDALLDGQPAGSVVARTMTGLFLYPIRTDGTQFIALTSMFECPLNGSA
jgi:hypothetical protein